MTKTENERAKDYLVRAGVWDPDYRICAMNIATKIADDWKLDDNHEKYGRRAIAALCEIYAATQATPVKTAR